VDRRPRLGGGELAKRVRAHQVEPGDRIRWYGRVLTIERVRLESQSSTVVLYAGTERILMSWDQLVDSEPLGSVRTTPDAHGFESSRGRSGRPPDGRTPGYRLELIRHSTLSDTGVRVGVHDRGTVLAAPTEAVLT
jgi:hypothetical protein